MMEEFPISYRRTLRLPGQVAWKESEKQGQCPGTSGRTPAALELILRAHGDS